MQIQVSNYPQEYDVNSVPEVAMIEQEIEALNARIDFLLNRYELDGAGTLFEQKLKGMYYQLKIFVENDYSVEEIASYIKKIREFEKQAKEYQLKQEAYYQNEDVKAKRRELKKNREESRKRRMAEALGFKKMPMGIIEKLLLEIKN